MSAGWRRNLGLLFAHLQRTPSPAVLRSNALLALRALGPLSLPLLLLAALQGLCSWDLVARAVRVVAGFCGGSDSFRGQLMYALGSTALFAGVMLSTSAAAFVVFFCTLLESSPPADLSAGGLTRFLVPVYLAVLCPAAASYVLDAPLLVATAVASLPLLLLSWPHLPEVLQLMVLFVRAKVNSRGRTRDMLDAIMGRIRPSRLTPLLAECVLQMGLLNFVTRQGLDALLLDQGPERPSLLLAWVAWPLLYLLVYACTRTFVSSLSQLSGGICLMLLGVRYEWLRRTLEAYPGPLLGRLAFVLRMLVAHCREHFALTRMVCRHLPAAFIFLFFRLTTLSPPFKCAASLVLAVFGFYQWMGLLRFPVLVEESWRWERGVAEDQRRTNASAEAQESYLNSGEPGGFAQSPNEPSDESEAVPEAEEPVSVIDDSEVNISTEEVPPAAPNGLSEIDPLTQDISDEGPEPRWPNELRARRRNNSPAESSQERAPSSPQRRERGLMDSVNSLIANSANIPRSLNRVHEEPNTR